METQLLGGMIRHPTTIPDVLRFIGSEHFRTESNRVVFSTLVALRECNSEIDLVVLAESFYSSQQIVQVGGNSRLFELWDAACPGDQVVPLAQLLCELD